MAYIESHQELARHPKTRRAARKLAVSLPALIGHLHLLWYWALDYAEGGELGEYSNEEIADAALWDGDADLFVGALEEAKFIDVFGTNGEDGRAIHHWHDYAGKLVERRVANRDRMRNARANRVTNAPVVTNAAQHEHVQEMCGARAGASVAEQSEAKQTEAEQSQSSETRDAAQGEEESTKTAENVEPEDKRNCVALFIDSYRERYPGETPDITPQRAKELKVRASELGARYGPALKDYFTSNHKFALDSNHDVLTFLKVPVDRWKQRVDNAASKQTTKRPTENRSRFQSSNVPA